MIKVYGIHGYTKATIHIPTGKHGARLAVEFDRGRMGLGPANRPAIYTTADPGKQALIENSPMFGKQIRLIRWHAEESDIQAQPAPEPKAKADRPSGKKPNAVPGVESREDAVMYLKAHGAKAVHLKDDESIKKYMEKIGVTFPNADL